MPDGNHVMRRGDLQPFGADSPLRPNEELETNGRFARVLYRYHTGGRLQEVHLAEVNLITADLGEAITIRFLGCFGNNLLSIAFLISLIPMKATLRLIFRGTNV